MQILTPSRLRHTFHFLLAHTIASLLALCIFFVPLLAPYTPYAEYINWAEIFPYFKPFAGGLFVSIWLLAIIPALAIHKVIRLARLYGRTDHILIGAAAGLAISLPVLKFMGMNVIDTNLTPDPSNFVVLIHQVIYALAWCFSGAAFGLCYYYLHSENYYQ
jgi:hypothetical protein